MARFANQRGETLIEVLISIVLVGAISSAVFLAFTAQTKASSSNQELVSADAVIRQYAEYAKSAVRQQCNESNPGSTVTVGYTNPNYAVTTAPSTITCPPVSGPVSGQVSKVDITVNGPHLVAAHLSIDLRTP